MSTPPVTDHARHLGDFTVGPRVLLLAAWAIPIGAAGAGASWALQRLIGLVTNLVFYHRIATHLVSPGLHHHSPLLIVLAPPAGGLVIGLMARYGSEKIRGHGMPEAIEAILVNGSRVQPRVALLKPVSAAISLGTGGPFGAEGPIIMTGGAIGSIFAQSMRLSAIERKTLMVAGAAAGMTATFNAPLASILLATELLLFEFKPRSFVPLCVAVATATLLRVPLLGGGALFGHPLDGLHVGAGDTLLCVVTGVIGGLFAIVATKVVYTSEDAFTRLPLHWMWWPALGGVVIGLGGLVEPRALGVGYDVIRDLLTGHASLSLIVGILVVKTLIWGLSLGSGTSGGVLAPIIMMGAALGALESHALPHVAPGFWAIVGFGAVIGGVMRLPLTGVVFPLELTHAWPLVLPLVVASSSAFVVSALVLKRSILTERIARRGLHLSREYAVDPLEVLLVEEVMSRFDDETPPGGPTVHVDDTLREAALVLARAGVTSAPVVERDFDRGPVGVVTVEHLLQGRLRDTNDERHREQFLFPLRARRTDGGQ